MSTGMSDKELHEIAKKRVKKKRGFYRHLRFYLFVNIILIIIWAATGAQSTPVPWFVYPLGGWGFVVVWDFLEVFIFSKDIRLCLFEKSKASTFGKIFEFIISLKTASFSVLSQLSTSLIHFFTVSFEPMLNFRAIFV